jgi:hypothetical protein
MLSHISTASSVWDFGAVTLSIIAKLPHSAQQLYYIEPYHFSCYAGYYYAVCCYVDDIIEASSVWDFGAMTIKTMTLNIMAKFQNSALQSCFKFLLLCNVVMLSAVMLNIAMLSAVMLNIIMLSVLILNFVMLSVLMLRVVIPSVVMLSVFMLSVLMLSVMMLSVTAPGISVVLFATINELLFCNYCCLCGDHPWSFFVTNWIYSQNFLRRVLGREAT